MPQSVPETLFAPCALPVCAVFRAYMSFCTSGENREPVMVMYWGDLWTGSQKGFFYTLFYDQTGSADSQFSGYLYTTFTRTGNLWWEPWMGGEGAIYSTINGVGGPDPIAECDNCSRVIRYVVTYGARLDSNALVQMRVHDVNVLTDLDRVNPTSPDPEEPVGYDGTVRGIKPSPDATSFVDFLVSMSTANTISWWTGWWPVLHVRTSGALESGAIYSYQVGVDILGAGVLEEMIVETPVDDDLTDAELEAMARSGIVEFLGSEFPAAAVLVLSTSIIMFAIDVLLNRIPGLPTPAQLVLFAVLLASYTVAMLLALAYLWNGILNHETRPVIAVYTLIALIATLMMQGYWNWGRMVSVWGEYWQRRGLINGVGTRSIVFCLLTLLTVLVKAFFIGVALAMMVRCYELWCMGW